MALGGGSLGLLIGAAFLLVSAVAAPLSAFTVGQVAVVGSLGTGSLLWVVAAQITLGMILVGDLAARPAGDATAALFVAVGVGLVGVTVATVIATSLLTAALLLAGGITLVAYLFHRYELLRLGLIEEANP